VASGTPSQLKARAGRDVIEIHTRHAGDTERVAALVGAAPSAVDAGARRLALPVDDGTNQLVDVVRALDGHGFEVEDVALRRPTLDEVFLILT
jgi:ABC-2 type transport system ATP-binding protein